MKLPTANIIQATCFVIFFAVLLIAGWMCSRNSSSGGQTWYCGPEKKPRTVKAVLKDGTLTIRGKGAMRDFFEPGGLIMEPWGDNLINYEEKYKQSMRYGRSIYWPPWYFTLEYDSTILITDVIIEEGVTHIGSMAFAGLPELRSITIPASVSSIGKDALLDRDVSNLTSITVTVGNNYYNSEDGIFFNENKTTLILYPRGRQQNTYIIPNSVTTIGKEAFYGCKSLTSVTIPNSVTIIEKWAFAYTRLTSVVIPNSVISIKESTFFCCENLASVTIPNSVASIRDDAFHSCTSLTFITIPDGVTSIGDWTFLNCTNLTSITISKSVTSIGNLTFFACPNLTLISIQNLIPPTIGEDVFHPISNNACLYVPKGSIDAYRRADGWRKFKCIKAITTENYL